MLCCTVYTVKTDGLARYWHSEQVFQLPTFSVGRVAEVDLRMALQEKEGGCSRHQEWQMRNLESLWEKWPKWGIEACCSWQKNDVIPTGNGRVDLQKLFKILLLKKIFLFLKFYFLNFFFLKIILRFPKLLWLQYWPLWLSEFMLMKF